MKNMLSDRHCIFNCGPHNQQPRQYLRILARDIGHNTNLQVYVSSVAINHVFKDVS